MSLTTVFALVQVQGLHFYADAPEEVYYLAFPHRHLFTFKCYKQVHHDNRDVEFIMLKNQIRRFLETKYHDPRSRICDFGFRSCEMLAKELIVQFKLTSCEVSEDGENGCVVLAGGPTSPEAQP
jgi:hypothetical protein